MQVKHPYLLQLTKAIDLEESEEDLRFRLDKQHSLKLLKAEGLALHPIIITGKNYGYADYPEIGFRLPFPPEGNHFRDGSAVECFLPGEEPVKGILLFIHGSAGAVRLNLPDYPDWIEEKGLAIKLTPDLRTLSIMRKILKELYQNKELLLLFTLLHDKKIATTYSGHSSTDSVEFQNTQLNASQRNAVRAILENEKLVVVHGPPGTGKTTTLVEAICQLVKSNEKIVVSAPSNMAVDNIAKVLISRGMKVLRVGNSSKVDRKIFPYTPEGKLANSREEKEIKDLKKRAEEFRRMALKYKRKFGKAEREQRNLLFKEVKEIRNSIKKLRDYNEEKFFVDAQVILGTPIGLYDANLQKVSFHTLVIDEAAQCLEPLAWCVFPLASRYVVAGDHLQLPPTVISREAGEMGLEKSVLEICIESGTTIQLLDTQYRMHEAIAGFSNKWFYEGLMKTPQRPSDSSFHLTFIDTAGAGYFEEIRENGFSLYNRGELNIAEEIINKSVSSTIDTAFISPYAAQVGIANDLLSSRGVRTSTIDGFQGQEMENIIISLVRSNDEGAIGFLKDYRRMNVAMTRAKEQLFIIGDSSTIGSDSFYHELLSYIEAHGNYRSVWEFDVMLL